ncbi:hypothetical protein KEM60_01588 [Austwickia sp. TVS 96-490-7B]|uniref:site-2 protease family protein n=1 Tax=Austwickia sp. TVS 96-490-7B TaxID=2830843 RepID=UPI001C56CFC6|nr:site-2 protease family protein [Austwickia sp. TVS 96-490-7B]MBW3085388.1 hypothetical protein [Austwickia sp. TVS 96-490-7B]
MPTGPTAPPQPTPGDPETPAPGIRIGTLAGIPLYLTTSWFLIAALIVLAFGPDIARSAPQVSTAVAYLVALGYAILLALSVLCHEIAHALVARASGYAVDAVVINLWGGHTAFTTGALTPGRSALISVSGPAANAALAVLGWLLQPAAPTGLTALLLYAWTASNAFVAVFNLLPGLPLDGGHLLEAAVWKITGRRSTALTIAGWGGRILTIAAVLWFIGLPLTQGQRANLWNVAWLAFIGAFLWVGAGGALSTARSLRILEALRLHQLRRPIAPIPQHSAISDIPDLIRAHSIAPASTAIPVVTDTDHHPIGLLDPVGYAQIPTDHAAHLPASTLLLTPPASWTAPDNHHPDAGILPYVDALMATPYGVIVLTDPEGHPTGALTSTDVARAAGAEDTDT